LPPRIAPLKVDPGYWKSGIDRDLVGFVGRRQGANAGKIGCRGEVVIVEIGAAAGWFDRGFWKFRAASEDLLGGV